MIKFNVYGRILKSCCQSPMTGYFRDGLCRTDDTDHGRHIVCAIMTEEFLDFSRSRGNDLSTPIPEYAFPGLKPGDHWCLCALRWVEAYEAGKAPQVDLEATEISALRYASLDLLEEYALSTSGSS